MVEIQVAANDAEQRLDRFLRKLWPNATLGLIQRLVRKGAIRGDGQKLSGSDRLVAGMTLRFDLEDARFAELRGSSAQRADPRRARPGRGIGTLDVDRYGSVKEGVGPPTRAIDELVAGAAGAGPQGRIARSRGTGRQ
ncbi:MAG: hypothetical protein ACO3UM_15690, partial [Planctomycetota bacterium]